MKNFRFSFIFSVFCLALASYWGFSKGGWSALFSALMVTSVLAIMEISLSFDNAIINASVLKNWNDFWKKAFLMIGIFIAVFGMRLLFPILIVSCTTGLGFEHVIDLALYNPEQYSAHLIAHHGEVAAFGGMFLLLVFLNFMFDEEKETHWFNWIEKRCVALAKVNAAAVFIAIAILLLALHWVNSTEKLQILIAGIAGILIYLGVGILSDMLDSAEDNNENATKAIMKGSIMSFIYLEILDASFSFDGVIGAFAITNDVVIIMLGLAIGAIFVRSLTIFLVEKGTLNSYIYLEHGAHYAIGSLALIMLLSIRIHISEVIVGLLGVTFILWSVVSSIREKQISSTESFS